MEARAIAIWAEHDRARAIHDADRAAIEATEPVRSLVLDLFGAERDWFNACARLGSLLGTLGASPTLAATTFDGAVRALRATGQDADPARIEAGRALLLESFVAAIRDAERAGASAPWEYPGCGVPLADGAVAIACNVPLDDADALAAWADRTVGRLVKAGVRRIVLAGPERARNDITSAAGLVGIEVGDGAVQGTGEAPGGGWGWLRLPWRKRR